MTLCDFAQVKKFIEDVNDPEQHIATLVQTKSAVLQVHSSADSGNLSLQKTGCRTGFLYSCAIHQTDFFQSRIQTEMHKWFKDRLQNSLTGF
jgi:hypothetical protein